MKTQLKDLMYVGLLRTITLFYAVSEMLLVQFSITMKLNGAPQTKWAGDYFAFLEIIH